MLIKFDNFIFEQYGSNQIVRTLTNFIFQILNDNIGKILLNKNIQLKSTLSKFDEIKFVNDIINVKISNRSYGNVNPKSIFITDDIISNLILNLELVISPQEIIMKKLYKNNEINKIISHELLHIIELFLTEKNKSKLSKSWEYGEKVQLLQKKYKETEWQKISHLIYLSLPHEMRARVEELNKELEINNISGILDTQNYIKTTKIYKDCEILSRINPQLILNKLKSESDYKNLIKDFCEILLDKYEDYEKEFLIYITKLKNRNKKFLDKLLRSSYNFEQVDQKDIDIDYNEYL
jgi:hypothetical protein